MKLTTTILAFVTTGCLSATGGGSQTETGNMSSDTGTTLVDADSSTDTGLHYPEVHTSTDAPSPTTGNSSSGGIEPFCGNGVTDAGEICDDGVNDGSYDGCMPGCKALGPRCDDNVLDVNNGEVCDDGVNDGSYDGCMPGCKALAPYCGDNLVNMGESCDSDNLVNSCLPTCAKAQTCRQIKDAYGTLIEDTYTLTGPDNSDFKAYCDPEGNTYLKIGQETLIPAMEAEIACAKYGLGLYYPFSKTHLDTALKVALGEVLEPIGPGPKSSTNYLYMMGIYPKVAGQSCEGKALNHVDCPEWTTAGGTYFVTNEPMGASEPGSKTCTTCSMAFYWKEGKLDGYESFSGENNAGARSNLIMCHDPSTSN